MLKKFFVFAILTSYFLLLNSISLALEVESPRFKLNIDTPVIDLKSDPNIVYTIESLYGPESFKDFKTDGYSVNNLAQDKGLLFSVSHSFLNLGEISPGKDIKSDFTYALLAYNDLHFQLDLRQEYPLKNFSGEIIPATDCDGGKQNCTPYLARLWTSPTAFGFGYALIGDNIPADFINADYFRPLPNQNKGEQPVTIIKSSGNQSPNKNKLVIKLNAPPSQSLATYETIIDLVAIPGY